MGSKIEETLARFEAVRTVKWQVSNRLTEISLMLSSGLADTKVVSAVEHPSKRVPHGKQTIPGQNSSPAYTIHDKSFRSAAFLLSQTNTRMSVFDRLPLEIRVEIANQIETWDEFLAFRNMDSTNRRLFSSASTIKRFRPTADQFACVRWVLEQSKKKSTVGDFVRELLDMTDLTIYRPIDERVMNSSVLAEFTPAYRTFHNVFYLAKRSTKFVVAEGKKLDYCVDVIQPSLYIQALGSFEWNPFGFELGDEDKRRVLEWLDVLRARLHNSFGASLSKETGCMGHRAAIETSHFEYLIVIMLGCHIDFLHLNVVDDEEWDSVAEAHDWSGIVFEKLRAMFIFVMRVFEWEKLANGATGNRNLSLLCSLTKKFRIRSSQSIPV